MKRDITQKVDEETGVYTVVEKIETTPEDGFVHKADINPSNPNNFGTYEMGYSKRIRYETNDPKVTKPALYIFTVGFLLIGIIVLILGFVFTNTYIIGWSILWIILTIVFFIQNIQSIKKIEDKIEEVENNNKYK